MPRVNFKLVFRHQLISKVHFLVFETANKVDFVPGQFFSLEVSPKTFRSYSTVYVGQKPPEFLGANKSLPVLENESNYICFMISTKPNGVASKLFEEMSVGMEISAVGPNGKFRISQNKSKPKVFIATGTGLAPFVGMIKQILDENEQAKIQLFFGVWTEADNFVKQFFETYLNSKYPNFEIYTVIDDSQGVKLDKYNISGRVTTAIPSTIKDFVETEFYLCGHPMMVADMAKILEELGAKENIFLEKFGK
jgi:all-trans-retinol 13,14-reductase